MSAKYVIPTFRIRLVRDGRPYKCDSAPVAADVVRHVCCEDPTTETMVVLFLDGACRLYGSQPVASGGSHALAVTAREIYAAACRANATAIILGHNHPSGDPNPSDSDIVMTRAVKAAGEVMGVPLVDHVIVTDCGRSYSFTGSGLL